jgi:Uma2 family endonuclease
VPETTIVLGEVPVGWNVSQRQGLRVPDLLVAFDVNRFGIIEQRGYSIHQWGKPPDFVLEVASEGTGRYDIAEKRADYAAFGIPEYWRFDPSGGQYHGAPLDGDQLVDGAYQPIPIENSNAARFWGHSEALGLDLCWEDG